ncbi:MAG: hypothetical protein D6814_00180 [Calditrichaeota bacterium]|nr:MAG: hypothetical protein D6814_00180 [Calditrichota bacterium]
MKACIKCGIYFLLLSLLLPAAAPAQTHIFLPANLTRVRALALAGAVTSLEDNLSSISYNPANFTLYQEPKRFRFTLFLSPLMPGIIANNPEAFLGEPAQGNDGLVASILSLFKGIDFTLSSLEIGFQFGEPRILDLATYRDKNFLHADDLYKNHYESVVVRLRLAEQVSVGSSIHLMYFDTDSVGRRWKLATSYGVAMQPHRNVRFGVSVFTFPNEIRNYRMLLEQVFDEAINLGISYQTPWDTKIALDVRNVSVGQKGPREQYFMGIEQEFFKQIALRGGIQYHTEDGSFTFSTGAGLFNLNILHGRGGKFRTSNYAINYALVFKKYGNEKYFVHALNFMVRI